ncbi:hypothetical protein COO60DRAFT_413743 [Scenedesmus sp. NREL 46B-D3]|nr:hypothetical protein COO60DRAFT_413743 [Scenedesmus sp. NREL 46B-D3]
MLQLHCFPAAWHRRNTHTLCLQPYAAVHAPTASLCSTIVCRVNAALSRAAATTKLAACRCSMPKPERGTQLCCCLGCSQALLLLLPQPCCCHCCGISGSRHTQPAGVQQHDIQAKVYLTRRFAKLRCCRQRQCTQQAVHTSVCRPSHQAFWYILCTAVSTADRRW